MMNHNASNKKSDKPTQQSPGQESCQARYRFINKKGKPLISAASLRGLPVRNNDNENLGVLKELMIETDRGTVAYAVLLFEDDKSFALPFGALEIDPESLTIYVDIQREVFEQGQGLTSPDTKDPKQT